MGVGFRNSTKMEAVTVGGGALAPVLTISEYAPVQLLWQSRTVEMMPPLRNPPNAWWYGLGVHLATTRSPSTTLRILRPSSLSGPQPKQTLWGAYLS